MKKTVIAMMMACCLLAAFIPEANARGKKVDTQIIRIVNNTTVGIKGGARIKVPSGRGYFVEIKPGLYSEVSSNWDNTSALLAVVLLNEAGEPVYTWSIEVVFNEESIGDVVSSSNYSPL